jgi:hypothetical protein
MLPSLLELLALNDMTFRCKITVYFVDCTENTRFCHVRQSFTANTWSFIICHTEELTTDPRTAVVPFLSQHSWYNVLADMIIFRSLLKMAWQLPNNIMIFSATTFTIQHTSSCASHIVLVLWCSRLWHCIGHLQTIHDSPCSVTLPKYLGPEQCLFIMCTPLKVLQFRDKIWC